MTDIINFLDLNNIISTVLFGLISWGVTELCLYIQEKKGSEKFTFAMTFLSDLVSNLVLKYEQTEVQKAKKSGNFNGVDIKQKLINEAVNLIPEPIQKTLDKAGIQAPTILGNLCESVVFQLRNEISANVL